jgi:ParB-like chromosome segregation protein Spo0J
MSESPLKQNKIIALDELIPHPDNYRSHPDEQVQNLVLSLQRFGQGRSIVIQDSPGKKLIVAGHGIVEAAKSLKWPELRADVLPADWTPEAIRGYLIADNQHSQGASDDDTMLAQLLQEQQDAGFDLASLGTDDETLRQMLEALGDAYVGEDNPDVQFKEYDETITDDLDTEMCKDCGKLCLKGKK